MTYGEFIMYVKPTFCIKDSEGVIGNLDRFRDQDFIIRLDFLQDWIFELQDEYNLTLRIMDEEDKKIQKAKKLKKK
jgi:hypothetical protein